ncbi:MAG: hypothetical protein WDZ52_02405 [Pseudohongiellaceae bacterium]
MFLSDENGECGLSNAGDGVMRFYPDGNELTIRFSDDTTALLILDE